MLTPKMKAKKLATNAGTKTGKKYALGALESKIRNYNDRIAEQENKLAGLTVDLRSAKATLKEAAKGSDEHTIVARKIEQLTGEISTCKDRIRFFKDKLAGPLVDHEKGLELYKVKLLSEVGSLGYEAMLEPLRAAITDAKDLYASYGVELDGIAKRYNEALVKETRERLDAGVKVINSVAKALGRS